MVGETGTPESGLDVRVGSSGKPDASHALTRGVVRANGDGMIWYQFCQFGRAVLESMSEMLKVGELVPHLASDANAVFIGVTEALLEQTKEASTARDTDGHAA